MWTAVVFVSCWCCYAPLHSNVTYAAALPVDGLDTRACRFRWTTQSAHCWYNANLTDRTHNIVEPVDYSFVDSEVLEVKQLQPFQKSIILILWLTLYVISHFTSRLNFLTLWPCCIDLFQVPVLIQHYWLSTIALTCVQAFSLHICGEYTVNLRKNDIYLKTVITRCFFLTIVVVKLTDT